MKEKSERFKGRKRELKMSDEMRNILQNFLKYIENICYNIENVLYLRYEI